MVRIVDTLFLCLVFGISPLWLPYVVRVRGGWVDFLSTRHI